jgi:hypothetical protein
MAYICGEENSKGDWCMRKVPSPGGGKCYQHREPTAEEKIAADAAKSASENVAALLTELNLAHKNLVTIVSKRALAGDKELAVALKALKRTERKILGPRP